MESANEKITSSPSSSPLPSSSDHLQAAPESEGIGNSDPRLNQTVTGAGEIASAGKGLSPKTPASTSGPLEVDVGNVVATSENSLATTPSPAGSLLSTSYIDEDFQGGSTPKTEQLNGELSQGNDSATQSPPKQVMERPSEPSTPYRIPDYVFARKPSTAPMEWSAASNESLFSIQMGNMSFTREQFAFLGKSGELGLCGEQNMSGPYIDFSSNQPPDKQVEFSQNGGNLDEGPNPRVTEAKAVETMREVIREIAENDNKASPSSSADNHSKGSPSPSVRNPIVSPSLTEHKFHNISSLSHASDGSTKSFAFPVLSGEERSGSLRVDGVGKQKQHSPRRGSRPQTPKESRKPPIAASQSPKSALTPIKHKWLPCSCCPFCN